MFKALKEKVSNEYEKAKVNNGAINSLNERASDNTSGNTQNDGDISTRKDMQNSSVAELSRSTKSSLGSTGFSLVDLDDDNDHSQSASSQSVSMVARAPTGKSSTQSSSGNEDSFFKSRFNSLVNNLSSFVPQSDIESEYESESAYGKNLENVSKEQLIHHYNRLKDRSRKYRERWTEVVKAYRESIEERDKLKNVLTETQDKNIRRVNELKEQCTLEQEAKRHLEENLRMVIEEKEEQIKVLQKQFEVLNVGKNSNELMPADSTELLSKIERLETLLAKCNESLKTNKEKLDVMMKENESLLIYKNESAALKEELEQMKKVKESTTASFVEAKQRLHDELESRKIIIKELKDQLEKRNSEIKHKNAELKTQQENLKKLSDTLNKNVEAAKSTVRQQADQEMQSKLDNLKADFQNQLERLKEENDQLKSTVAIEQEIKTELKSKVEKLSGELKQIPAFEQKVQELNEKLAELENVKNVELSVEHVGIQVKEDQDLPVESEPSIVQEWKEKFQQSEAKMNEKIERIKQLETMIFAVDNKLATIKENQLRLENENDKLKSVLLDKETLIQQLQLECDKNEKVVETLRTEYDSLQKKLDSMKNSKEELTSEIGISKSELIELKNRLISIIKDRLTSDDITELSCEDLLSTLEQSYRELVEENKTLEEIKSNCETLKEKEKRLVQDVLNLKTSVKECKKEIKTKNHQISEQQQFQIHLQDSLAKKDELITKLKQDLENGNKIVNETIDEITAQNKKLEEELKTYKENSETFKNEMNELSKQNSILQEEIGKIKSNAKEILESKQKLKEELQNSDLKVKNFLKFLQIMKNKIKQQKDDGTFPNFSELNEMFIEKNGKITVVPEMKELVAFFQESFNDKIETITDELKLNQQKYQELEERIKSRDVETQELRTEVIALEEKLKSKERSEKYLKEELTVSEELNDSLREQIQNLKIELKESNSSMNSIHKEHEERIESLYNRLEIRETQLDESLLNASAQHNLTNMELIKARSEISQLQGQLESYAALNRNMTDKLKDITDENNDRIGKLTKQYESQIEALQLKLEEKNQEVTEKMDQLDNIEDRLVKEHKETIAKLKDEITEKNTALEEVHTYYQHRLKAKENELKHLNEQLTSTDRDNYQINALQNSILQYHEENLRLKELVNMQQETNKTGPGNQTEHGGTVGSRNRLDSDMESCAILGVHLPQPTEYEYLRNILFEFMCGREPVTLAKVIAAVMRFNNEQTEQIIRRQESIHSSSSSSTSSNHLGHYHHKLPK